MFKRILSFFCAISSDRAEAAMNVRLNQQSAGGIGRCGPAELTLGRKKAFRMISIFAWKWVK
jgi:hypothetical protein